jgi:hypothetical protein
LSRVLVGVVLSANLMDDLVAEGHVAESSRLAWLRESITKDLVNLLRNSQMIGVCLAVD